MMDSSSSHQDQDNEWMSEVLAQIPRKPQPQTPSSKATNDNDDVIKMRAKDIRATTTTTTVVDPNPPPGKISMLQESQTSPSPGAVAVGGMHYSQQEDRKEEDAPLKHSDPLQAAAAATTDPPTLLTGSKTAKVKDPKAKGKAAATPELPFMLQESQSQPGAVPVAGIQSLQDDLEEDDEGAPRRRRHLAGAHQAAAPDPPTCLNFRQISRGDTTTLGTTESEATYHLDSMDSMTVARLLTEEELQQEEEEIPDAPRQVARPVTTTPSRSSATTNKKKKKIDKSSSPPSDDSSKNFRISKWLVLIVVVVVLMGVVVCFAITHVMKDSSPQEEEHTTTSQATHGDDILSVSNNLISLLPGNTQETIRTDPDGNSPQAQAYRWLVADPHLRDYPTWRILQRYALATLFFSTTTTTTIKHHDDGSYHLSHSNGWVVDQHWLDYEISECHWKTKLDFQELLTLDPNHITEALVEQLLQRRNGFPSDDESGQTSQIGFSLAEILHPPGEGHGHDDHHAEHHDDVDDYNGEEGHHESHGGNHEEKHHDAPDDHDTSDLHHDQHHPNEPSPLDVEEVHNHNDHHHHRNLRRGVSRRQLESHDNIHSDHDEALHEDAHEDHSRGSLPNYCDDNGVYRRLWLYNMNLQGTLPPEVFSLLPHLQILDVCGNPKLKGTLPSQIGRLTDLEYLFVEDNAFSGTIPSEIGALSQLQLLSMDRQPHLTGSLPTELGRLQLVFYMTFPHSTGLSGPIPSELANLAPTLQVLDLTDTGLMGTLPSSLTALTELRIMQMGSNPRLEGNAIRALPTWRNNLQLLDLRGNVQLEGNITDSSQHGPLMLRGLDIRDTQINGVVPQEICQLQTTSSLAFTCSGNLICGCDCDCS